MVDFVNFALKEGMKFILFQFGLVVLNLLFYLGVGLLNKVLVEVGLEEFVEAFQDGGLQ